jgi:hypothetical protein
MNKRTNSPMDYNNLEADTIFYEKRARNENLFIQSIFKFEARKQFYLLMQR